jgi:hypothetical protein
MQKATDAVAFVSCPVAGGLISIFSVAIWMR